MRSVVFVLILFSASTFACPNLAGKYDCLNRKTRAHEVVTMKQENRGGVEIYTFTGPQLFADNVTRDLPESENFKKGTLRAWCDGEFLRTKYTGQIFRGVDFLGNITARQNFQKYDTVLTVLTKGEITGGTVGGNVDEEITCEEMTP